MAFAKLALGSLVAAAGALASSSSTDVVQTTVCNGQTFTYDSMVAWGFIHGRAVDNYGDTISFGSSVSLDRPSLKITHTTSGLLNYSATVYNLPDRGWNTMGTTNFEPRVYKYHIDFQPAPGGSFSPNIQWTLEDTIILTDPFGNPLTGFDCDTTLEFPGFPDIPAATFEGDGWGEMGGMASSVRVCLDPESINLVNGKGEDGFWITDEYGPYMYRFNSRGMMVQAIRPVDALIPIRNGTQQFSADAPRLNSGEDDDVIPANPTSGRNNNQGFEGGSLSPTGKYLYSLLQSATIQDGGSDKTTNRYTRLFRYDITNVNFPKLVGEWVVPLPMYNDPTKKPKNNPRTAAQSELYALSDTRFLVLSRDSSFGHGQDESASNYRQVDTFDISKATNIYNVEKYNKIGGAVAPDGKLDGAITPAIYCPFLNVNLNSQLNKFAGGLHNGGAQDWRLLNEKWEGIALFPADGAYGADGRFYVLITSDDDFITTQGHVNFGRRKYRDTSGFNLDNQALIFLITLPQDVNPFKYYPVGAAAK
ncbi:esterase-like activity of phytase-domain-containing protein [Lipomyces tetrasporus]|uniref:Esterase-like activity of phytase-domain-containing protein n=1 Tax=Lipomyces tetrasporus TaxID=54092 RepID=A0AAD7QXB9_9ASCO|nr:esterase-like activity of phytase-domain-containing protein [Lipomyces tetrasporus]KAJ8103189.1 esterase-like activity of phytase-domain-containing protein [Lipomyces tetrasporus]